MVYADLLSDEADAFIEVVDQWATTTVEPLAAELDRHEVDVAALRDPMEGLGLLSLGRTAAEQQAADPALVLRTIDAVAGRSAAAALLIVAAHAAPAEAPHAVVVEALGTEPIVARPTDEGGAALTGTAPLVSMGGAGTRLAVIADLDDTTLMWELDVDQPGLTWRADAPRPGLRGCPRAIVDLDDARGRAVLSPDAATTARAWWTVGTAAAAIGTARRALRDASAYLGDRNQFGRPLAELPELDRIVRHHHTRLMADRTLLGHVVAGWTTERCPNGGVVADAATRTTADALESVIDALQLHGGYGYIDEYPVERCFRDIQSLRAMTAGWADALRSESR